MTDRQRASKGLSRSSSEPDTGVFPTRGAASTGRDPVRALRPTSGFSLIAGDPKKASWDDVSLERDPDGETKNYSVPPELIELARRAKSKGYEAGTLTPLAPKPTEDVVVVVPRAAPLGLDVRGNEFDRASSMQAPSVPIALENSYPEPESAPAVVYKQARAEADVSSSAALIAAAERPPVPPAAPRLELLIPCLVGVGIIGFYVLLCYYGVALLAGGL